MLVVLSERAEVVTEQIVAVRGSRQAAPLQRGHQPVGDFNDGLTGQWVLNEEPIAADLLHYGSHVTRDAIRGTDEIDATAARIKQHLAQRSCSVARQMRL